MSLEIKREVNCCVPVWSSQYFSELVLLHFVLRGLFGWMICYWIFFVFFLGQRFLCIFFRKEFKGKDVQGPVGKSQEKK